MRMIAKKICIKRPPLKFSVYKMSEHKKSKVNPIRENLLFTSVKRMNKDGLSNIHMSSSVVDSISYGVYTKLLINVGKENVWTHVMFIRLIFIWQFLA